MSKEEPPVTPRSPNPETSFGDWRTGTSPAHNHEALVEIDERLREVHQTVIQTQRQLEFLSVTVNRIDLEFERARDQVLILVASARQHDQILIEIGHSQQALAKSNEHLAIELANNMEAAKRHTVNLERALAAVRQRVDSHDSQIERSEKFGRDEIISTHEEAKAFQQIITEDRKSFRQVFLTVVVAIATAIVTAVASRIWR